MSTTAEMTQREIARELRRSMPFSIRSAPVPGRGAPDDGLTLEGDAAVFNTPTTIDSWEGRFREAIVPGAFKKTLRETKPKLQFDHGSHPLIGSIPIGQIRDIYEDGERALHVVARLFDNWLIQPVREAISNEAIDGMSFRFTVVREEWRDPADGKNGRALPLEAVYERLWDSYDVPEDLLLQRFVKELKCQELGPVVFPAYAETTVGVRSITIDLGRLNQPEQRAQLAKLARAAMLSDLADASSDTADAPPPGGAPVTAAQSLNDAPPATAGHPSDDTPPSSDAAASAAPPPPLDPVQAMAARMQSTLARIHERSS